MNLRKSVSIALAMTIVMMPIMQSSARDQTAQAECPIAQETQQQNLERGAQRAAVQAATAQLYNPLTQSALLDVIAAIHNADILTDAQSETVSAYIDYTQPRLTQESLAVQADLLKELEALGILPHELDTRDGELTIQLTNPDWPLFVAEADALFHSLPGRANSQRLFGIITLGVLAGIVACDFKIQACADDTLQEYTDCFENRICEEGECANKECCAEKAASDTKNCLITCGLNGPDGDYANCCE